MHVGINMQQITRTTLHVGSAVHTAAQATDMNTNTNGFDCIESKNVNILTTIENNFLDRELPGNRVLWRSGQSSPHGESVPRYFRGVLEEPAAVSRENS